MATKILTILSVTLLCVGTCIAAYIPIKKLTLLVYRTLLHGSYFQQGLVIIGAGVVLLVLVAIFEEKPEETNPYGRKNR